MHTICSVLFYLFIIKKYVLFYNHSFQLMMPCENTNSNNDSVTFEPLQRARHVQTPALISAVGGGRGGEVGRGG